MFEALRIKAPKVSSGWEIGTGYPPPQATRGFVGSSVVIAKFHYMDTDTDPTRTRHGPDTDKVRARCRVRAKFHYTGPTGPARTQRSFAAKSPCGSVRVRSGPCRVRVRVRVVEFSSSPTMCADFVRVVSGPCRVRVVEFSYKLPQRGPRQSPGERKDFTAF